MAVVFPVIRDFSTSYAAMFDRGGKKTRMCKARKPTEEELAKQESEIDRGKKPCRFCGVPIGRGRVFHEKSCAKKTEVITADAT